ncbi:hypothetical protein KFU94_53940 [Chloroflexi bacterium TSY]|nr:hypothetical protein [Chloroflexi bacterium TSY]
MNATGKTIEIDVENAVSGRDIPDTQMAPQETEVDVMATIPDVGTPEVPISREETKTEEESVILNVDVDSSTNRDTDRSNVSLSQEETKTVVVDAPEVDVDVPSVDTDVSNESEDSVGDFVVSKSNYPDDLTQIKGIGLVYQERLNENNIYTWDQVANLPVEQLKDVTKAIDAAKVDAWAQQALDLAQKNNRIGARYNGPLPDRLSKIPGIGKQTEQTLRQGGIFTYSQLANSTPGELNAVLPTPRDEQDLMAWITGAATMVDDG